MTGLFSKVVKPYISGFRVALSPTTSHDFVLADQEYLEIDLEAKYQQEKHFFAIERAKEGGLTLQSRPPTSAPWIKLAPGLARKWIVEAISSGVATRPRGIDFLITSPTMGCFSMPRWSMGVLVNPGHTSFTRRPLLGFSRAD